MSDDKSYKQFVADYIQSEQIEKTEELTIVYIVSPQSETLTEGCFPNLLKKKTPTARKGRK